MLIDATEQETPKPKDRGERKGNYSGKKKRHTLKTQVTTSFSGLLLHVSRATAGKVNDLTLLRGSGVLRELPTDLDIRLDRGYDGIERDNPSRRLRLPYKADATSPWTSSKNLLTDFRTATECRSKTPLLTLSALSS